MADKDHKYIFWLDLETTGSDLSVTNALSGLQQRREIIEVGAAITDMNLNVLDGREYVIHADVNFDIVDPVVYLMHQKNGLWQDVAKSTTTIGEADNELAQLIRKYNGSDHMAFAGSGVSHFDRKFIKRDMPLLDKRLTHWAIDVGVMRRVFKYLLEVPEWPSDTKDHRAYGDVLFHIEEMRFALDKIESGVYNG